MSRLDNDPNFQQLQSEVRKLKALVLSKFQQGGAVASSAVDFVVDIFDRDDQDGLGRHWDSSGGLNTPTLFSVRNRRAVGSGIGGAYNPSYVSNYINSYAHEYNYSANTYYLLEGRVSSPITNTRASLMYGYSLSSKDMNIKIVFDGPPNAVLVPDTTVTVPPGYINDKKYAIMPFASAGIAVAAGMLGGFTLPVGASVRAIRAPSVPYSSVSSPAHTASQAVFGSVFSSVPQVDIGKLVDANIQPLIGSAGAVSSYNYFVLIPTASNVQNTANTLEMNINGDLCTVKLNGGLIYLGPLSVVDRSRVGLSSWPCDIVTACISLNIPFFGITSFKAWKSGMPEPSGSQSGHGKVNADGTLAYTDFFHRPIKNAQGAVTGYTYLPNG